MVFLFLLQSVGNNIINDPDASMTTQEDILSSSPTKIGSRTSLSWDEFVLIEPGEAGTCVDAMSVFIAELNEANNCMDSKPQPAFILYMNVCHVLALGIQNAIHGSYICAPFILVMVHEESEIWTSLSYSYPAPRMRERG